MKLPKFVKLLIVGMCSIVPSHQEYLYPGKIINGHNAVPHSAPYIVSIRLRRNNTDIHWCGASIIKPNWVITAAHCITGYLPMELVAGDHDTSSIDSGEQRVPVHYRNMHVHEKYEGGAGPYDIALILLHIPFNLTETVKTVVMPVIRSIPSGKAQLFGWGNTSNSTSTPVWPHILQTAEHPIVSYELCVQIWADSPVHPTNLCAGYLDEQNGSASCNADSGGPLVGNNNKNETTLIGLVSWGSLPCGQAWTPTVFVRVSAFIDWINRTISKNSERPTNINASQEEY